MQGYDKSFLKAIGLRTSAENKELFKSKLEKFIVKRAAVFLIVLSAAALAFLGENGWLAFAGLFAGTLLSVVRLIGNELIFKAVFKLNGGKAVAGSILVFTAIQLILLPVILLVYFLNVWILYGFVAGILAVPVIVMINSITEAFGITKNNFE